jgi:hypothetical protein
MATDVDARTEAAIREALSTPEPGALTQWELYLGEQFLGGGHPGEREPGDIFEASWSGGGDGAARSLEARIAGQLPPTGVMGEDVRLDLLIAGHRVRGFTGIARRPTSRVPSSTLRASTAGFWNPNVRLGEPINFSGTPPDEAYLTGLLKNAWYNSGAIDVARGPIPPFTTRQPGLREFRSIDSVQDLITAAAAEAQLTGYDNRLNGHDAFPDSALLQGPDPAWTLVVGEDIDDETWNWEPAEENEYTEVFVYAEAGNNEITPIQEPISIPGALAPPNSWMLYPVTDNEAHAEGFRKASEIAARLALQPMKCQFDLTYVNPFFFAGVPLIILEPFRDVLGVAGLRTWHAQIVSDTARLGREIRQEMEVEQVVIREEKVGA